MSMSYLESRPAPRRVSTKAIRDMEETHHAGSRINVGEVERWA
ncbi:MAG TPA: hypothetical protein VGH33_25900 [Isosphaeraceae bacterium]|jgi:hypothetical protein